MDFKFTEIDGDVLPTINDLDEEEILQIYTDCNNIYNNWNTILEPIMDQRLDYFKAYRGELLGNEGLIDPDHDCPIEWPSSYKYVEANDPQLKNVLFPGGKDFYKLEGANRKSQPSINVTKKITDHYLLESDFQKHFCRFVKQAEICGSSYGRILWKQRIINKRVPVVQNLKAHDANGELVDTGVTKTKMVQQAYTIEAYPVFKTVSVFDILTDPTASTFEESAIIHKYWATYDELFNENKEYKSLNGEDLYKLDELLDGDDKKYTPKAFRSSDDKTYYNSELLNLKDISTEGVRTEKNIRVLDFVGDFLLNDKMYYDYIITVADNNLIGFRPNPYYMFNQKPFVYLGLIDDIENFNLDNGLLSGIVPLQYMQSYFARLRINTEYRNAAGIWGFNKNSAFDPSTPICAGAKIPMDSPNDLWAIGDPCQYNVTLQEQEYIGREMEEITGATSIMTGQMDSRNRTATEQQVRLRSLNIKNRMYLLNIEKPMKQALEMYIKCIQAYADKEVTIKVIENGEEEFKDVRPIDALADFEYKINITATGIDDETDTKLEKIVYIFQMLQSSPYTMQMVSAGTLDLLPLVKDILQLSGVTDDSKVIFEDPKLSLEMVMQLFMILFAQVRPEELIAITQMQPQQRIEILGQFIQKAMGDMQQQGQNGQGQPTLPQQAIGGQGVQQTQN
jgi:hypothetical protein